MQQDVTNDPAYQVAKDALEACAQYAASNLHSGWLMKALQCVSVAWEDAPRKQIIGRKRPQSGEELTAALYTPCKTWLPYAEALRVADHPLLGPNKKPTQVCDWIASSVKR